MLFACFYASLIFRSENDLPLQIFFGVNVLRRTWFRGLAFFLLPGGFGHMLTVCLLYANEGNDYSEKNHCSPFVKARSNWTTHLHPLTLVDLWNRRGRGWPPVKIFPLSCPFRNCLLLSSNVEEEEV